MASADGVHRQRLAILLGLESQAANLETALKLLQVRCRDFMICDDFTGLPPGPRSRIREAGMDLGAAARLAEIARTGVKAAREALTALRPTEETSHA